MNRSRSGNTASLLDMSRYASCSSVVGLIGAPALRRSCRSASCRKSLYRAANRKPFGVLAWSGYSGSEGDTSELIAFLLDPSSWEDAEISLTWQISGTYLVEI